MQTHSFSTVFSLLLVAPTVYAASNTTYQSNFSSLAVEQPLVGVDGWSQSEPNFTDGFTTFPRAYGTQLVSLATGNPTVPAASVGGFYDSEPISGQTSYYAEHSWTHSLANAASYSMEFAINDSEGYLDESNPGDTNVYGATRNAFYVSFNNLGGDSIFALHFTPFIADPDPIASPDDVWNISWSSFLVDSGNPSLFTSAIYEGTTHSMNINFSPTGAVSYDITGQINTWNTAINIPGLSSESIATIRIGMEENDANYNPLEKEYGTNDIAFAGINAVPEPSSIALLGLSLGGLLLRRRR